MEIEQERKDRIVLSRIELREAVINYVAAKRNIVLDSNDADITIEFDVTGEPVLVSDVKAIFTKTSIVSLQC